MRTKFLLLLGVSGVGKSTIIANLRKLDNRFVYISPYTTRTLRKDEKDKIFIIDEAMDEMNKRGKFLAINKKYGIRYATPLFPIIMAFEKENFPVLDWPINSLDIMTRAFSDQLCVVYLLPPSMEELKKRLAHDSRDVNNSRIVEARQEIDAFNRGEYEGCYSLLVTTFTGEDQVIAQVIYGHYLKSMS